jgi:hypothetical protein
VAQSRHAVLDVERARSITATDDRRHRMAAPNIPPYDFDVVTRRVDRSCSALERRFDVVDTASVDLRVDRPLTRGSGPIPVWHTTGRLYGSGPRVARYTRVHLEITAWSEETSELRMRPFTRRIGAWGARRQRRYFARAHDTIDDLIRSLDTAGADQVTGGSEANAQRLRTRQICSQGN